MRKYKLCVLLLLVGILMNGCTAGQDGISSAQSTEWKPAASTSEPEPQEPLVATLAVCGDTMSHMPQTNDAWNGSSYDYGDG